MSVRLVLVVGLLSLVVVNSASAIDAIKRKSGPTVSGTISKMSATEVAIEKQAGGSDTVQVGDIDEILFDKEPTPLKSGRTAALAGQYENALTSLEKVDPAKLDREELAADVRFFRAFCQAKIALGGGGDIAKAGNDLIQFVTKSPSNYHFYEANELVGDLLVTTGKFDNARTYYATVERAPFADYKARAKLALGRLLVAEKKFPEALAAYDAVVALGSQKGALTDSQRLAATLGKANCLALTGKPDEGLKMVDEVIAAGDPEDGGLMAQAYLTKGTCYLQKPDAKKQALLAFLHIDILYPGQAQAQTEALRQLAKLWNELGKPERATAALQQLQARAGK